MLDTAPRGRAQPGPRGVPCLDTGTR